MVKEIKKEKSKIRIILVVLFIAVFTLFNYISLRGRYLEYKELGENFINVFITNTRYNYIITGVNFILLYIIFYFTTRGIKKGLKAFSEKEDKVLPKLPNKSISLIISAIVSVIMGNVIMKQLLLCIGNTSFEITDPIFNLDIS